MKYRIHKWECRTAGTVVVPAVRVELVVLVGQEAFLATENEIFVLESVRSPFCWVTVRPA